MRPLGCFMIDLNKSLLGIHLANLQALAGSRPGGHSFVGQLRRYAMASLLAYVIVREVHLRFVQ